MKKRNHKKLDLSKKSISSLNFKTLTDFNGQKGGTGSDPLSSVFCIFTSIGWSCYDRNSIGGTCQTCDTGEK